MAQQDLRSQMAGLLKQRLGTQFEVIHQDEDCYRVVDGSTVHTFDVNYDNLKVASSVVSASYVNLATAQLNLSSSMSDLLMFNKLRPREQLGLAILVPSKNTLPSASVYAWEKRSEEHTSELQSPCNLVCRLLLEKKKNKPTIPTDHLSCTDQLLTFAT